MGRVQKHRRRQEAAPKTVTPDWAYSYIRPRLTDRDLAILRFIADHGIVKESQIRAMFFRHRADCPPECPYAATCGEARTLAADSHQCQRRLRRLYDLGCIDRHFPAMPLGGGTAQQHVVLDKVGAALLGIDNLRRVTSLPITYRHTVAVADLYVAAHRNIRTWQRECSFEEVRADVWARVRTGDDILLEVDTGTERMPAVTDKLDQYAKAARRLRGGIPPVWFLTDPHGAGVAARLKKVTEYGQKAGLSIETGTWADWPKMLGNLLRRRAG